LTNKKFKFENAVRNLKSEIFRLTNSTLARNAAWLLTLNLLSRVIGFFGNIYAISNIGPVNLGISAIIQTAVQQAAVVIGCGFDTVAVRKIANDHGQAKILTESILSFRLFFAAVVSFIWLIACYFIAPESQRWAWMIGAIIIFTSAGSIAFVFSGIDKLPIQSAIGAAGALLSALVFIVFFYPNIFLGADLIVIAGVSLITTALSWWTYYRIYGGWPIGRLVVQRLQLLFRESWRYWLLAIVISFYSIFQIPLIAIQIGVHEAGIYRSAFLLAGGVELLFNSINSLLLPRLVNWHKAGPLIMWHQQTKLFFLFIMIGIPIIGICIFAAPIIYSKLLGNFFEEGLLIFQILVVGRFVVFLGQIYAFALIAVELDTKFLYVTLFAAILSISINLVVIPIYGITGVAFVSVFTELALVTCCYLIVRNYCKNASFKLN
jgi:O-antigen/teichoic acid export membrane protein